MLQIPNQYSMYTCGLTVCILYDKTLLLYVINTYIHTNVSIFGYSIYSIDLMCFCSIVWGTTVRLERCPPLSHQPLWSIQTQMQSKQKVRERPWICDEMWEKFMSDKYTPEKLRWHWKIPMFNRKYFFEWWIFHCYVRFQGCNDKVPLPHKLPPSPPQQQK